MMKTKIVLLFTLLYSTLAFAGIHDACHAEKQESRVFAVAYITAGFSGTLWDSVPPLYIFHRSALPALDEAPQCHCCQQ